jgi:hypothetical protein
MSLLRNIASGLRSLFQKEQVSHELDEELNGFLEMAAEEKIKQGMSRKDALRAVRLERGSLESTKEVVRSAGWESFVETLWQDLRFGVRVLSKSPGFTAVAILTLALGIGANTAIFTVVNGVLLRPMPFAEADRLALVSLAPRGGPFEWQPGISDRDYLAFRKQDKAFESVASFTTGTTANLTGAGDPAQIPVAYVTSEFFSTLRTSPEIGRGFVERDGKPGGDDVVVLSHEVWKERFGSDARILRRTVKLDSVERTVIGVMPPGFHFPEAKAWLPLIIQIDEHNSFMRNNKRSSRVSLFLKLKRIGTNFAGLPLPSDTTRSIACRRDSKSRGPGCVCTSDVPSAVWPGVASRLLCGRESPSEPARADTEKSTASSHLAAFRFSPGGGATTHSPSGTLSRNRRTPSMR